MTSQSWLMWCFQAALGFPFSGYLSKIHLIVIKWYFTQNQDREICSKVNLFLTWCITLLLSLTSRWVKCFSLAGCTWPYPDSRYRVCLFIDRCPKLTGSIAKLCTHGCLNLQDLRWWSHLMKVIVTVDRPLNVNITELSQK